MNKILIIITLIFGFNNIQAQRINLFETGGNLESLNPCGCVEISEITNEQNPADILNGMKKCIEQKDFDKAVRLFVVSGVYGVYDNYRVKDKSTYRALISFKKNIFLDLSEEDRDIMLSKLKETIKEGSEELNTVCRDILKVGVPTYYPKYMVQHGNKASRKMKGDGLVKNFNSKEFWILAVNDYLHCGE